MRGRRQIRIWAVVRIQRAVRRWLRIAKEREDARFRQWQDKKRWKKKLEGDDYRSDEEEDRDGGRRSRNAKEDKQRGNKKFEKAPKKDRRYALYWDEKDDPR